VNSGNKTINSILNYKMELVERSGHILDLEISLPGHLELNSFDISTIIGNILDNAIEALEAFDEKQKIKFSMKYDRGTLFIHSINPFKPEYHKPKRRNHKGLGLKNIDKIVDKYDGILTIDRENQVFDIIVLLYV
jgi:sensor histidine kinase regulating citrate/malate metabolism